MDNLDLGLWEYLPATPSNCLKSWGCAYSGYREDVGQCVSRLEVPKNRVMLILGFGDRLQVDWIGAKSSPNTYQTFVVGLGGAALLTEHAGAQRCIEVELLPWTANRLLGGGLAEVTLSQGIIDLEEVWGNEARFLTEQLSEQSTWQERFSLVDQMLAEKFTTSSRLLRPEIQWAWEQLESYGGCISIRALAREIGWSDRHFATCFRDQIGITPKAAARQIRFHCAHRLLTSSKAVPLSEIATTCGYSDQSHFTREFRQFSGCSPTLYQQAHFPHLPGIPSQIVDR